MKIKTISYKRVLNLGNYENKHLELFAEVDEGENPEEAILQLADTVERTIRESVTKEYNRQMLQSEAQKEKLLDEIAELKHELKQLGKIKDEPPKQEADPDDIPFDQTPQAQKHDPSESF
ncbi:MAG: hypothetical protein RM022_014825 [Nostoc sp. EfeVER01]|uniref:hypothetical protein n=1 Tax=unclassified Nostoc TaxID=2593658 RepID=UPI002AD4AE19|nr:MULTISPECIES: hypothetical protein [unclassified Nostoc]MDZ7946087.1 hypothetical protein [Nostoc sp. EfeVER01]MDZ7992044.1 hypothetical protein [Nostoc sp. EspVER01]